MISNKKKQGIGCMYNTTIFIFFKKIAIKWQKHNQLVKWTLMYHMNQWNYVTWISVEQISPPPLKKNRLYKISEAELSLGNIKTDVRWFQDYLHSLPNFTIHRIWWIIIPF